MTNLLALVIPFTFSIAACSKADKKDEAKPSATSTTPTASTLAPTKETDTSKVQISVTEKGFEPESVDVPAGKPVTLVFTRTTDKTCAKEFVLTMDDGKKIEKELPLNTPVELAMTFPKAGKLGYACGMDMFKGTIVVQ
jgi:plastocyanin domain-containing protein